MDEVTSEHVDAAHKPFRLALGIERFGLISLRFPILSVMVLVALSIAAAFGISRIKARRFDQPIVPVRNARISAL